MSIHPTLVLRGCLDVLPGGDLRSATPEESVPRYQPHLWGHCPVLRLRSRERLVREALAEAVKAALEEGRRPPQPRQLSLLPEPARRWRRVQDGWIDLTLEGSLLQAPRKPWNGVVVVDLTLPSEPVRPN